MKTNFFLLMTISSLCMAQVTIPEGTKIRVRLDSNLSSDTADLGQNLDFSVTQEVRVGDAIVIANGARATGSVTAVAQRRRLGKGGRLDFSIDRVMTVEGSWLSIRYTPNKTQGKGSGAKSGLLTAGIGVVFWPAAPLGLLVKGKDVEINRGRIFEVFSDESHYIANAVAASAPQMARALPQAHITPVRTQNGAFVNNAGLSNNVSMSVNSTMAANAAMMDGAGAQSGAGLSQGVATLSVKSNLSGADIEVNGMFVGNTPTTIQLPAGVHNVTVKQGTLMWQRDMQITGGSVSINATLDRPAAVLTKAASR